MKFFDLTLPNGERNPKIHKIDNEVFRKNLVDFPGPLAERMVELGYGKWAPMTPFGNVPVPQALHYPEQILFVRTQTRNVKGCHVNALVDNGPVPSNLQAFCYNLKENINFTHNPTDLNDEHPDFLGDPEDEFETVEVFEHDSVDLDDNAADLQGDPQDEFETVLPALVDTVVEQPQIQTPAPKGNQPPKAEKKK
jgi:hypothetical protein